MCYCFSLFFICYKFFFYYWIWCVIFNFVEWVWLFVFSFFWFGKMGLWLMSFILGCKLFGIKGRFLGIFIVDVFLKSCLVRWFFKEWKVMIDIWLLIVNKFIVCCIDLFVVFSLLLILIWIVWKICLVGWFFFFSFLVDLDDLIILVNFVVVDIVFLVCICLIFWVICFENLFLLYLKKIFIKLW